jgi:predicted RNase H-like HicB family nuclease
MKEMTYQDYSAKVEYDPIDKIFVGHIIGIRDIVGFHGSTVEELESAFHEAVHHFTAVFEQIDQWWIAYVEELPGANTQGASLQEICDNLKEAIQLILETNQEIANRQAMDKEISTLNN